MIICGALGCTDLSRVGASVCAEHEMQERSGLVLAMKRPPPEVEGRKDDSEKPRVDLLDPMALNEVARVLTFGAKKYGEYNWTRGMAWHRPFAALLRHAWAFWGGEEFDPETGLSHMAHAMCCCMFLLNYQLLKRGTDDRNPR